MGLRIIRKYRQRLSRKIKGRSFALIIIAMVLVTFVLIMNQDKRLSIIPASYKPLLDLIADVESRGNYNAYFGNARNSSINFTAMTIDEVLQWQNEYVAQGSPSSAVGRYQIINTTLADLMRSLNIDPSQRFDEAMQDRMAVALLERRGSVSYVNNELGRDDFAANLAKEWASLPKITGENPNDSYYSGDGLNKSLVDKDKVLSAIDRIEPVK